MKNERICFLVGSMAISGGTYVIVQHASYLTSMGYDVTLAVQEPFTQETLAWHDQIPNLRCVPFNEAKPERFDLVIATWWKTALELSNFDSDRFCYFVQSIESRFYPSDEGPLHALVDSTYDLPLNFVTEATWIKQYLAKKHGKSAALVKNGIRKDIYKTGGECVSNKNRDRPRVLIEGPFGVSFKNTALSIRLAKEAGFKDIWVLTGSPVSWVPGVSRVFSRVPMTETPNIYRSCDILLKLSTVEGMFGPPLEIFHCGGTAVVFDVSGHDEYIVDGVNACVLPRGNLNRVVAKLKELLADRELVARLKDAAITTADAWPDWEESSAEFQKWIDECLSGAATPRQKLAELTGIAFSNYDRDERERLKKNPRIVRRYKLLGFSSRFPSAFVQGIKQLRAVAEVLFGKREAF